MSKDKVSVVSGIGVLLSILLGSGVIIVPPVAVDILGGWAVVSWFIMAAFFIPIVLLFAHLGKRYPDNSGTAYYVKKAFGGIASKSVGILYVSVAPIAPPVVLIAGAAFISDLLFIDESLSIWVELSLLTLVLFTNLAAIKFTAHLQLFFSVLIVISLLGFSIFIISQLSPQGVAETNRFSIPKMGTALAVMFWSFIGIEAISHIAKDLKDPKKDFPIVVIGGVFLSVIVYACVTYTIWRLGAVGTSSNSLLSVTEIGRYSLGELGAKIISFVGLIGCFSTVNLYILSFGRMLKSVVEEKKSEIPNNSNRRNFKYLMPVVGAIAFVLFARHSLSLSFSSLMEYSNGVFVAIYTAACVSGLVLFKGAKRILSGISTAICGIFIYFIGMSMFYSFFVLSSCLALFYFKDRFASDDKVIESY